MEDKKSRNGYSSKRIGPLWLALVLCISALGMTKDSGSEVSSVTLEVGHRMHPNFHQQIRTEMNTREQVGDSDFFFEITEFYPHFTYVDSTKQTISLSDEPENPAFKIRVYNNEELIDDTWAFFSVKAPHFAPTSYLKFHVTHFRYRGETYKESEKKKNDAE
ncbi:MAG: hypothetical protein JSW58_17535 [Candidatus Latescibacterota bacterium]|nr:MAG: hypothetical protein JSW58_17535 [Candidatus Latescibacterota bacterium]